MNNTEKQEALLLLKDLISISSVNPPGKENTMAEYLKKYFEEAGVNAEILNISSGRSCIKAVIQGKNKRAPLVFCGHLDTVPFGEEGNWTTAPLDPSLRDGKLYGRGTSDMKGGLAAMAYAMTSLSKAGKQPSGDIVFWGTADEEADGLGATAFLTDPYFKSAEAIIIGEPTDGNIGIAAKGTMWLEFTIKGKPAHGSYPDKGINSAEIGMQVVLKIKEWLKNSTIHPLLGQSTGTLTLVNGGVKFNVIPDLCTLGMDVRMIPAVTSEQILDMVQEYIHELEIIYPGLHISLHVKNNRLAVETKEDCRWVQQLQNFGREVYGKELQLVGTNFFSDASIFVRENKEVPYILYGPGITTNAHIADEYIVVDDYYKGVEVYRCLMEC